MYCRPSCPARTPKRGNVRFFADRGSRADGRVPLVQAVPARRRARLPRVEQPERHRRSGHAPHRRRRRRPGGRDRPRRPSRVQRPPPRPPARRRARCRSARARPGPTCAGRPDPHRDHRPPLRRRGLRVRLREPAPVQRHRARRVRDHPDRAPEGPQGGDAAHPRRHVSEPGAITLRLARREPFAGADLLAFLGSRTVPGRRGGRRDHLRAHPRPARRTGDDAPHRRRPPRRGDAPPAATCATSSRPSPGPGGCSTSTRTRRRSTSTSSRTPTSAPWSARHRGGGCPAPSPATSSRSRR